MTEKTVWLIAALVLVGLGFAVVGMNPSRGWAGSMIADEELEFVVTDAATGKPIPDTTVGLYAFNNQMGDPEWIFLTTDGEGRAFYFRGDCICDQSMRDGKLKYGVNLMWCDIAFADAEGYEQAAICPWQTKHENRGYSREDSRFRLVFSLAIRKGNAPRIFPVPRPVAPAAPARAPLPPRAAATADDGRPDRRAFVPPCA